ncbi:MAG TPA: hypothetical protein VFG20_10405 [Planctomycetaceae bacterium]|nr:hypothetical protein [Planctomycetaceae bacterium]
MNREWVQFHLQEALDELTSMISAIDKDVDYTEAELDIALTHIYNHINTAWNSRNVPAIDVAEHTDADFYEWRGFPKDIQMGRP